MLKHSSNLKRNRGFTLVEVVIAVGLMAVVSVLSWRALSSMTTASETLQTQYKQLSQLERIFAVIEGDLNQLAPSAFFTAMPNVLPLESLTAPPSSASTALPNTFFNTDLGLIRTQRSNFVINNVLTTGVLQQQLVRYRLKDGRFERLVSEQTSRLLTLPPIEESGVALFEDVQSVSWAFYPPQTINGQFNTLFLPASIESFSVQDYQNQVRPLWQNLLSQNIPVVQDNSPKQIDLSITLKPKNSSSPITYQRTFLLGFGV